MAKLYPVPPWGKRGGKERFHLISIKDKSGVAAIAIAKLDTKNWTVDQWHVISSPHQPWEKKMGGGKSGLGINEASFPLYHGDDIWITFSASHCMDPGYSLGLLKYNGGDPLQKPSWDKWGSIVSAAGGHYGIGHNAFFPRPTGSKFGYIFLHPTPWTKSHIETLERPIKIYLDRISSMRLKSRKEAAAPAALR
ncbi:unnamed protein product [Clonostachys chloroleuca]|uniref:Uncharacterized protein n=1 Tax=Clonostachys chloroleuca TaxID=1926264 RepID=A0AA35PWZ7_9HYPO|nr:unnamed protein product [Clonostachys chloroleuca]